MSRPLSPKDRASTSSLQPSNRSSSIKKIKQPPPRTPDLTPNPLVNMESRIPYQSLESHPTTPRHEIDNNDSNTESNPNDSHSIPATLPSSLPSSLSHVHPSQFEHVDIATTTTTTTHAVPASVAATLPIGADTPGSRSVTTEKKASIKPETVKLEGAMQPSSSASTVAVASAHSSSFDSVLPAGGAGGGGGGGGRRRSSSLSPPESKFPHELTVATDARLRPSSSVPASSSSAIPPPSSPNLPLPLSPNTIAGVMAARSKKRLPQSGLRIFGKKWLLGAEDLALPACCSLVPDLFLLILSCIGYSLSFSSSYPSGCSSNSKSQLQDLLLTHILFYIVVLLVDFSTMISAVKSNMFQRNLTIVRLVYARILVSLGVAVLALTSASLYFSSLQSECTFSTDTSSLHLVCVMIFVSSLLMVAFAFTYTCCSWGCGALFSTLKDLSSWRRRLDFLFCCYVPGKDIRSYGNRDVLSSIASVLAQFLSSDDDNLHVVPSDVIVGLALVEATQRTRKRRGYKFRQPASSKRWDKEWVKKQWEDRVKAKGKGSSPNKSPSEAEADSIQSNMSRAAVVPTVQAPRPYGSDDEKVTHDHQILPQNQSAPFTTTNQVHIDIIDNYTSPPPGTAPKVVLHGSPSPPSASSLPLSPAGFLASPRNPLGQKQNLGSWHEMDPAAANMADVATAGRQPELMEEDWKAVAQIQYFYKYARGSYGWMLYMFDNLSCVFTCKVCACFSMNRFNLEHMYGSGWGLRDPRVPPGALCSRRCCHWSINAFLIQTGVAPADILYANLIDAPIYVVAIDRPTKNLVICCRGTMSIADTIIDIDAMLIALDGHGYPGSYTHQGIFENALRCRDDIFERGLVDAFMEANPDYSIKCTGHSLGAGTAAVLTLLLREKYSHRGLKGICYAPPLLLDLTLAESPWVMDNIISAVNNNDIVPRLSLASVFQLKTQMVNAFDLAAPSKFDVLRSVMGRRFTEVFRSDLSEEKFNEAAAGALEFDPEKGAIEIAMASVPASASDQAGAAASSKAEAGVPNGSSASPSVAGEQVSDAIQSGEVDRMAKKMVDGGRANGDGSSIASSGSGDDSNGDNSHPGAGAGSLNPSSLASLASSENRMVNDPNLKVSVHQTRVGRELTSSDELIDVKHEDRFDLHLRRSYLPGRIYHFIPAKQEKKPQSNFRRLPIVSSLLNLLSYVFPRFGSPPVRPIYVYPSSQQTFQEIVVSKSMLSDHLPANYSFKGFKLPEQYAGVPSFD